VAEGTYYLFVGSCLIVGSLVLRRVAASIQRHRDSLRMERGIADYLTKATSEKMS
jgi:Uri superfamily endonuclease